ncbi:MAG: cob(I)yrinic acid a,c-diamide adenosyltransferase [Actinomycetota bacterium]|jgi:cob(I)alamin adenosyltransferase|nr:cob(I)yrinic acid a,c-diamide adenosyltransferase [Rubrobacter sp.]MDQ3506791.1 cob(I)yrinic acid a,c-diamide adenosyltransferase [Actinomycetota bacterium]
MSETANTGEARQPREERLRKRSRRERPLLLVNTGHGKGKSTASFGVMLRGWARGYKIGVYQFVKSGKWNVGEQAAAEKLGNIDWFKMGDGWTWTVKDIAESADLAREGWEEVKRRISDETYDMLLLDEFTYPMKFGWVDTDEVVEFLKDRPGFQHVIVTGRDAPEELIQIADTVSEVRKVKHPMDEGYKGQKGIEW